MLKRSFVVLACYVLSAVGILFMLIAATESARHDRYGWLVVLVWSLAWGAHLVMAGAWVIDRRLHRFWPSLGVFLGVFSFAAPAVAALAATSAKGGGPLLIGGSAVLAAVEGMLLLPSVLLAVKLVEFHWSTIPSAAPVANAQSNA